MQIPELLKSYNGLPISNKTTTMIADYLGYSSADINLVYQLDNAYWSDGYVKDDGTIAPNRPDFQYNEHFAIEPSTTYVLAYESSKLDCEVSWYTENKTFIRTDEIMNNLVFF